MQKITKYFRESWAELSKVNWPNRRQAIRLTLAVIAFSLVLAVFIALLDTLFSAGLQKLILKG